MAEQNFVGIDWEDIRIFVALARYGSLSAAARALSVTHATVSRRIQSLEQAVGEKLVERRPDGYVLTPAGAHLLTPANEMEAAAAKLIRSGLGNGPTGLVRVNAPPSLTQSFLVTRLAKLAVEHQSLDINVATDLRNVSLERYETDIALRFSRPDDGEVIAKLAVKLGFGFYASDTWCTKVAEGEAPVFVGFDESNAHLPEAVWHAHCFPRARVAFRANTQLAQANAAQAGAGIALLPHFLGRNATDLTLCNLKHCPPSRELWIITRRQDRRDLATKTVVDYLTHLFSKETALFE